MSANKRVDAQIVAYSQNEYNSAIKRKTADTQDDTGVS